MTQYSEPLSIRAVGDIMPGISSVKALATGHTIPERIRTNPKSVFGDVRPSLTNGDLLLGTLECPLTGSFQYDEIEKSPFLLGPERTADSLSDVNFDCLSLANNHMLDHDQKAVETTLQILQENDLKYVGDPFDRNREQMFQLKGRTIAIGGFNVCDQGRQDSQTEIFTFLNRHSEADLIVLLIHWGWGYEHLESPTEGQVNLGHDFVDAGADLVLGSHSHVFQPVEQYCDGVIAYSLGNFLFDMWRPENRESGILELIHDKAGSFEVSITPVEIIDGAVTHSHSQVDLIRTEPPEVPSTINRTAKIKNIKHNLQIVTQYLRYSTHLSREYHWENMRRWSRKLSTPEEVFR